MLLWLVSIKTGYKKCFGHSVCVMLDHSELAFRMLCRKYGIKLCYTPMIHSRLFIEQPKYRNEKFTTCKEDRPLVVQVCTRELLQKVRPLLVVRKRSKDCSGGS